MKNKEEKESVWSENILGILSLIFAFLFPLLGLILGIGALIRREKLKVLGVLAVVISAIFIVIWLTALSMLLALTFGGY